MCAPAAVVGVAAGQELFNLVQQDQFGDDLVEFREDQAEAIAQATLTGTVAKYSTLGRRTEETLRAAAREIAQISRTGASGFGTVTTSAAAAGVEGNTVNAALGDFARQELARIEVSKENLGADLAQIEDVKEAAEAGAATRLFQSRPQPVQGPNIFGALINIGTAAFRQYATTVNPAGLLVDGSPGSGAPATFSQGSGFLPPSS